MNAALPYNMCFPNLFLTPQEKGIVHLREIIKRLFVTSSIGVQPPRGSHRAAPIA